MKRILLTCAVVFLTLHQATSMSASKSVRFRTWPITAVRALEPLLKDMGLQIPASKIDGTSRTNDDSDGEYLSDCLCSVGSAGRGGTGSFVSNNGLILVSHD